MAKSLLKIKWLLTLSAFFLTTSCGGGGGNGDNELDAIDKLPLCSTATPLNVIPLDLNDVFSIDPLGQTGSAGHALPSDHAGFRIALERLGEYEWGSPIATQVHAPADGVINRVTRFTLSSTNDDVLVDDYALYFSPCRDIQVKFAHIPKLTTWLASAANGGRCSEDSHGSNDHIYRYCEKKLDIAVSAGEVLGTAGEKDYGTAVDFGAWDVRIAPLLFANPSRYGTDKKHGFDNFHVVCPLDLFQPDLRDQLYAKVGLSPVFSESGEFEPRTVEPICGNFAQDVAGTLHGNWFAAGTKDTDEWQSQLSMSYYNFDPTQLAYSSGQGSLNYIRFTPQPDGFINRAFVDVTADGNIYCYEKNSDNNRLLVQMLDETRFTLEEQSMAHCGDGGYAFTEAAIDYVR